MDRVTEMSIKMACADLVARYAMAFNRGDLDTFVGLFTEDEVKHLGNLTSLMTQYLERSAPPRPLCLAVFGAPGSGKSCSCNSCKMRSRRRDTSCFATISSSRCRTSAS